jgi:hypothetical protein
VQNTDFSDKSERETLMKRKKTDRKKQKRTDEKRLIPYIAAAGVTLAFAAPADSGIIYTPADIDVNSSWPSINMDNAEDDEFYLGVWWGNSEEQEYPSSSWVYGQIEPSNAAVLVGTESYDSYYYALNLPFGAIISESSYEGKSWSDQSARLFSAYVTSSGDASDSYGNFGPGNGGYLGVVFESDSGDPFYGWIHVDSIAEDFTSFHIDGWAFEDDEEFILAGDTGYLYENDAGAPVPTPEPSTLALLAMGASGVLAVRRRKKL